LSTEQAKRLTIGVELAANPAIIFADEPTSGLDASSARVVMDGIERIARSGRTVVCTIHQPSKAIFTKFDRLLLLRRGGEVVYFGDLGKNNCDDLLTYLDALPGTTGMPNPRYNPATYMLEAIGANAGPGVDYAQLYRDGDQKKENDRNTFAMQTEQLTLRWFRSYWRDPAYNTTRFVVAVIAALYFGLAFLMQGSNLTTVQDIQGLVGLLFMASAFLSFMSQNTVLPTVLIERAPFYRERAASYYGVAPLVIATTVSELPYIIAAGLVFVSIFYFIAGLWANASAFFLFWGFYTLFNMIITFWGHFLASALPNDQVANLVAAVVFSCWCFAAGLMIAISDVPYFWQWFTYINPLRYSLNGLVVSQLSCEDPSSELAGNPGCSVLETGETAWEYTKERFGYAADDIGFCLGACFGFAVGIRILNIFSYKYISYLKR
ncbi:ABC transporter G family member 35, partial [Hondaea fermentalgiana]